MNRKITAVIISFFLFSLSVPQVCFAELGFYFSKGSTLEISSKTAQAINLLDISDKIVRKYYNNTKDFFFNMYVKSFENKTTPEYTSKTGGMFLHVYRAAVINSKKEVYGGEKVIHFSGFTNDRMRGSPFGSQQEIIRQYLLSIEALQKGSVPAFTFIANNILL